MNRIIIILFTDGSRLSGAFARNVSLSMPRQSIIVFKDYE